MAKKLVATETVYFWNFDDDREKGRKISVKHLQTFKKRDFKTVLRTHQIRLFSSFLLLSHAFWPTKVKNILFLWWWLPIREEKLFNFQGEEWRYQNHFLIYDKCSSIKNYYTKYSHHFVSCMRFFYH